MPCVLLVKLCKTRACNTKGWCAWFPVIRLQRDPVELGRCQEFPSSILRSAWTFFFCGGSSLLGPRHPRWCFDTTLGRAPLDEGSALRRGLYLTTHYIHKGQTYMPPAGFAPAIPATERPQILCLIPRGHREWCIKVCSYTCKCKILSIELWIGMRRITTFRSTTDRIYDSCTII